MREIENRQSDAMQDTEPSTFQVDFTHREVNGPQRNARESTQELTQSNGHKSTFLVMTNPFEACATSCSNSDAKGGTDSAPAKGSKDTVKAAKDGRGEDFWGIHVDPNDLNTGRRALGKDVLDHLKDWDWLIDHKADLKRGLERAYSHMTPDAFKTFIDELKKNSDGRIYMETGNGFLGSLNPLNPPGDQVVRVYLQRGGLLTDDNVMDSRRQTSSPVYSSGGRTFDSKR